jgi:hypothetical protein
MIVSNSPEQLWQGSRSENPLRRSREPVSRLKKLGPKGINHHQANHHQNKRGDEKMRSAYAIS